MLPYMIGSEEIGSYQNTNDHSLRIFAARDPVEMARNSGVQFDRERSRFILHSLGQEIGIQFPQGTMSFKETELMPLWSWRLIILNHLARADAAPLVGNLITFRQTESGSIFQPAFEKRSLRPLVEQIASQPVAEIEAACLALGAHLQSGADVCACFDFLPRVPIIVKIWQPDEEMAGAANIFFDANVNHYLHTEDIAVASSLVATFLITQQQMMACGG